MLPKQYTLVFIELDREGKETRTSPTSFPLVSYKEAWNLRSKCEVPSRYRIVEVTLEHLIQLRNLWLTTYWSFHNISKSKGCSVAARQALYFEELIQNAN